MKTILGTVLFLLFLPCIMHGQSNIADSLKTGLDQVKTTQQKISLLLKLHDLSEGSEEELRYAFQLFNLAAETRDLFAMYAPAGTIIEHYMSVPGGADSTRLFLSKLEPYFKGTKYEGAVAYYRMVYIARELQLSTKENRRAVCDRIMNEISVPESNESDYDKAARLFLSGIVAYQLTTLTLRPASMVGLPYWEEGYALIQHFPVQVRRSFAGNYITMMLQAYVMNGNKAKLLSVAENYLSTVDTYFEDKEMLARRPYVSKMLSYLVCYHTLILIPNIIGQNKATEYFNRYRQFVYSPKNNGLLRNYAFFYKLCVNYYCNLHEYDKALMYSDSLITMSRQGNAVIAYEVDLYKVKADIYKQKGDWKTAASTAEEMILISDSVASYKYANDVEQMLVQIEGDRLAVENGVLVRERREKMTVFAGMLIVLLLVVSVIVWLTLRRQKKIQEEIRVQSAKARENDRLKNHFMENIYSDILVPLNLINTAADALFAENLSPEMKRKKAEQIRTQADRIITLMDTSLGVDGLTQNS